MRAPSTPLRILQRLSHLLPWRLATFPDILEELSTQTQGVFFIQVGSSDGVTADPLHRFATRHNWAGILIEPLPHLFRLLVSNYAGQNQLIFENVAIADEEGSREFWHLKETSESRPYWYDQIGSFDREHVLKHEDKIPNLRERLVKTQVECTTLEALIEKHHVTRVDLLHIDAEGHDFEILKQFDFTRFRPKLILYEHFHFHEHDRRACKSYLRNLGYRITEGSMDTLALSPSVPRRYVRNR